MEDRNSLVAFYATLVKRIHTEIADSYGISHRTTTLDQAKLDHRVAKEGISFLTKALPRLAKAFDRALACKTAFNPEGFEKPVGSTVPKFLGWLFLRIFGTDGALLQEPDVRAIAHARQLLYAVYKLELPYAPKTSKKVLDAFVAAEADLQTLQIDSKEKVIRIARRFITRVIGNLSPYDIVPKHGPGAVATGEKGLEKANFSRIYSSLEEVYPFTEYFFYSLSHVADELGYIESCEELPAGTAKTVLVPKDSRGPRLISCEPLELQWIQQGLMGSIVSRLESHRLTAGHINFSDQSINQQLTLKASITQDWVTLDMKEASDRVSLELVSQLFCGTQILKGLLASRSVATMFPDGRLIAMKKFAPMGSAVCFPVESLVFYALSVAIVSVYGSMRLAEARKCVYVYGDDLIVHAKVYQHVLQHLPRFGLLFNLDKCCTDGFFRESCGCDAYKGVDITPIKLKSVWKSSGRIAPGTLAAYVSYSNSFWQAGYLSTAQFIEKQIRKVYPFVPVNNDVTQVNASKEGWRNVSPKGISFYRPHLRASMVNSVPIRWNRKLQRREVLTPMVRPTSFRGKADSSWREMLRRKSAPSQHKQPGTYTLPRRVELRRGWSQLVD